MKLTRLQFDEDETSPASSVHFSLDLSMVMLDTESLARCRTALSDLLHGNTDFGRAFIEIDGIEIEATTELASHFSSRLAGRNELVKSQNSTSESAAPGSAAPGSAAPGSESVALRCALELTGTLPRQLEREDLEGALAAVLAEQELIVEDARAAVEQATKAAAIASDHLVRLDRWLTLVEPPKNRFGRALRKLQTPKRVIAREKLEASALGRELEISRTDGFACCPDFPTFAATARRERSEIASAAATAVDEATRHLEEVTNGTSPWVHARQLMIHEDILRRGLESIERDQPADDVHVATQSIDALLEMREDDFPIASDDAMHQAATWLGKIEGDSLRDELERQAIIHASPVAVLGTIPLILDQPGSGMTADAIWHALSVLDRHVGQFQIIVLDPSPEVRRWAASLGFESSASADHSGSGNH